MKESIIKSAPNLSYIPGSPLLQFCNDEDANKLKKELKGLKSYDYILIDNPPNINNLTLNSFAASESVMILGKQRKIKTYGQHKGVGLCLTEIRILHIGNYNGSVYSCDR
jgi:MinD-like ATPase involved in chromosome partitioning or flagellar assembly